MTVDARQAKASRFDPLAVTVPRDRLVSFADATGQRTPLYRDLAAAQAAGHPDLPIPPSFYFSLELEYPNPFGWLTALGVDMRHVLHGEQSFTYHALAHAGETLTLRSRITSATVKKGGALELLTKQTEITRNSHPIAESTTVLIVHHPPRPQPADIPPADIPPPDIPPPDIPPPDIPDPDITDPNIPALNIPALNIGIGTKLSPLTVDPISRTTLTLFADASGDHNAIHLDVDAARSAGQNDVFAQGMLSQAYLGRLLTDRVPQERLRSWQVRFTAITPVHARPTCNGRVVSLTDGLATIELAVTLPDGIVTLTGDAVVDVI